ncbi:nitrous oxide reductase accessory protein NosL [Natronocalculus amylovorans]|uniref:Nitrous oxide reductase accessory protein NosL n=1 Tax=Natronocalculus amylovorans TaxID=2917812 RepID=A0AAE3K9H0_9EURY|nr:nitrous oxide reductase accessory protein NosL [Natronocalculus amylovorans]MCL9818066.1 nitrous oxide reductase accessory protein NosL [Natronocalculus amylovorans]
MVDQPSDQLSVSRRSVVTLAAGGLTLALAGCTGESEELPAAISLDDGQSCDACGMVIEEHPGPTGQVFFEDEPADRDGPAWFCSGTCTYTYRFDREDEGWNPRVTYLTDYTAVSYDVSGDSEPSISAHLSADAYVQESQLFVVAGSDVLGAMGPDVIPFSDEDDAEEFASEYGGSVIAATDIDRELIDSVRA